MTEIRRATAEDAAALVRLRAVMFGAMGVGDASAAGWRSAAQEWFGAVLSDPGRAANFAAFVAVVEEQVVSCAVGHLVEHAPGPGGLLPLRGHVFNVATEPDHRRRGLARACLVDLLRWFDAETVASTVELHATGEGRDLYASLGFVLHDQPTLRRRRPFDQEASTTAPTSTPGTSVSRL